MANFFNLAEKLGEFKTEAPIVNTKVNEPSDEEVVHIEETEIVSKDNKVVDSTEEPAPIEEKGEKENEC